MSSSNLSLNQPALLRAPEVAIVIPTFEEEENIATLASRISGILADRDYEIIFVDDHSPDGTADTVRKLSRVDPRVRIIERIGRRGLASAVIEGLLSTSAPLAVIIDGDLQHDESVIPSMLEALHAGADVVIGSRYLSGGGTGDWTHRRKQISALATRMSFFMRTARVSDPMSGFFAVRTYVFRARADQLVGAGYKILLDFLTTAGPPMRIIEIAYVFRTRERGESKLDARVALEFLKLLLARTLGKILPIRFVMFLIVGTIGVAVHFLALSILFVWQPFSVSQFGATMIAMTGNFILNNLFTYADKRLKGWRLLSGWLSFCAASSVGLIANTGIAIYLYSTAAVPWYLAALAGIVVGATWNYVSTSLLTWRS